MYFYSRYLIYSLSSLSLHHSHVHDVGRPIPSARPQKHDARFQSAQFHERRVSRPRLGLGPIHRVHEPDDVIPGAIAGCIPRAALAPVSLRGASLGGWRPTSQPHSSSKDSTSLSDASAVNRRESSTPGRARASWHAAQPRDQRRQRACQAGGEDHRGPGGAAGARGEHLQVYDRLGAGRARGDLRVRLHARAQPHPPAAGGGRRRAGRRAVHVAGERGGGRAAPVRGAHVHAGGRRPRRGAQRALSLMHI